MFISLEDSVGNNLTNSEEDVIAVKFGLSEAGFMDITEEPEPHGIITSDMDNAIRGFQEDRSLRVDGRLFPNGETENALFGRGLVEQRDAPTQFDATGRMIRTPDFAPLQEKNRFSADDLSLAQNDDIPVPEGKPKPFEQEEEQESVPERDIIPIPERKPDVAERFERREPEAMIQILKGLDNQIVKNAIEEEEGGENFLYKDTADNGGRVTVGIGIMLPNVRPPRNFLLPYPIVKGGGVWPQVRKLKRRLKRLRRLIIQIRIYQSSLIQRNLILPKIITSMICGWMMM